MKLRVAVVFIVLASMAALAGAATPQEPMLTYFVEVAIPSVDAARSLAVEGYDVAGMDVKTLTLFLVVTPDELKGLQDKGWPVTVRSSNHDAHAIDALADYSDPQELSVFMDQIVATYPTIAKKVTTQPTLFEGQKQYALLITKDVATANDRPSFILDSQHHAREVMTQEIAKDMMDYLTSRYATDAQVQRWVDNVNIYVVPSVNPDGSMYVFQHDVNWRRNRHSGCAVDNNRNYPAFWGSCNGSQADCTSDINRGSAPGSEPETQGLMQLTSSVRPMFTLSYHSCDELLMYPYGCSDPDERSTFDEVAQGLNAILQNDAGVTGQYGTGPIWSTIYMVDGGSIDTQYNLYGAYGFSIEVNNCANGGFQPDYATWRDVTVQRQRTAWSYFLDKTLDGPQIRGTVTDAATGLPLPANLDQQEVTYTHGEAPRRADDKGHYHLLVQAGHTRHVKYSYPSYCPVTQTVLVDTGPVTVDVALIRPNVPQGVAAQTGGDNAIDLSWQPAASAVQYVVYRSLTSGGPYTAVATLPGTQTSFHDAPVSGGITQYYIVRTVQGCESRDSAEVSVVTSGACTVGPSFAGAAIAQNAATSTCSVNLSWPGAVTRCGGAVTYRVYRGTTASFVPSPANLIASGLTGNTFSDHAALTSGATYYYIVRAVDAGNAVDDGNGVAVSASPNANYVATWADDAGDTGAVTIVGASPWHVSPTGGRSGPRVYSTGTYPNNTCAALTTPAITLDAGASLSFASKFDMEFSYDFGAVEIATGPLFQTWAYLTTINYPVTLPHWGNSCVASNWLDPTDPPYLAFSGSHNPPTYVSYVGALNAFSGKAIKLRWHFSSDYSTSGQGWWIDDVAITNVVFPVACSAGAAANPKEVSPDGLMTASRSASSTAVDLSYTPGCGTLDNTVYWGEGPINGAVVWSHAACALGNTGRASFDPGDPPPDGLIYFVIVGQNGTKEGSYGAGTAGERPEAIGVGACDKPQDLTGSCP